MQKSGDSFDIQTTHDLKRDLLLELKKRHIRALPSDDIMSLDTGRGPKMIRASGPEGVPGNRGSLNGDRVLSNKPSLADGWSAVVAKENDLNIINGNLSHTVQGTRRRSLSSSSSDSSSPGSLRSRSSTHQRSPVSSRPGSAAVRRTLSNTSLSSSLSIPLQRKLSTDATVGSAPPLIPPPKVFLERKASIASSTSSTRAREQVTPPPPPPPPPLPPLSFSYNAATSDVFPSTLDDQNERKTSSSSSSSDSHPPSPSTSVKSGKSSIQDQPLPSPPPPLLPSPPPLLPSPPPLLPSPPPDSLFDFSTHPQSSLPSPPHNVSTLQIPTPIPSNPSSSSLLLPPEFEADRKSSMSPSEVMGLFDAALDDHSTSVNHYNDTPHDDHSTHRLDGAVDETLDYSVSPCLEMTSDGLTKSSISSIVHNDLPSHVHEEITHNQQHGNGLDLNMSIPVHKDDPDSKIVLHKDGTRRHSLGDQGVRVEIEERSPTSKGIRRKRPQSVALMVTKLRPDVRTVRQQIKPGTVDSLASLFTNMKHQYSVTSPTKEKVDFNLDLQQRLTELENSEKKKEDYSPFGHSQGSDSNTSPRDQQHSSFDLPFPSISFSSEPTVSSESHVMFGEVESRTSSRSNSTASNDSGHKRWRAKLKITEANMSGTSRSSSEDSINEFPESREVQHMGKASRSSSEGSVNRKPDLTVAPTGRNLSRSSSENSININPYTSVAKMEGNLSRTSSDSSIHLKKDIRAVEPVENLSVSSRTSSNSSVNKKDLLHAKQSGHIMSRSSSENSVNQKYELEEKLSQRKLSISSRSSSEKDINQKHELERKLSESKISLSSRSSSENSITKKHEIDGKLLENKLTLRSRSSSENSIKQNHELVGKVSESKLSLSSRSSSESNVASVKPILQATQSEGNLTASTGLYSSRPGGNLVKSSSLVKLNSAKGFDFLTASREIIKQINSRNSSRNNSLRRTDHHVSSLNGGGALTHLEEDAKLHASPVIGSEFSANFIKPPTHSLETPGGDDIATLAVSENESKQTEAEPHTSFSNIEQRESLHTADSRPQSQHGLGTQDTGNDSTETRFSLPVRGQVSETVSTATGNISGAKNSLGHDLHMLSSRFGGNEHAGEYSYDLGHGAKSPAYELPPPFNDKSGEVEHTLKPHTDDWRINTESGVYNNTSSFNIETHRDVNAVVSHTEQSGQNVDEVGDGLQLSVTSLGPALKQKRRDSSQSESDHSTSSSRSHSPSSHLAASLKSDVIMIDNQHGSSKSPDHTVSSSEKSDAGAEALGKDEDNSDVAADKVISDFQSILDFHSDKSHSSSSSSSSSDSVDGNDVTHGESRRRPIDKKPVVLVEPLTHHAAQATGQPGLLPTAQVEVIESGLFAHHISHGHETGERGAGGGDDREDDRTAVTTGASPIAHPPPQEEDSRWSTTPEIVGTENGSQVGAHQTSDDFLSILDDIKIETDLTSDFLGKNRVSGVFSREEVKKGDSESEKENLRKKSDHRSSSSDSDSSDDENKDRKSQQYTVNRDSVISESPSVGNEYENISLSQHLTPKTSIARSDSSDSDNSEDNISDKKSQSYDVTAESWIPDTKTHENKYEEIFPSRSELTLKSSIARSIRDDSGDDKKSKIDLVNRESLIHDFQTEGTQKQEVIHSHKQLSPKASGAGTDSDSDSSDSDKGEKTSRSYTVNGESEGSQTKTVHDTQEETIQSHAQLSPKLSTASSDTSDSDNSEDEDKTLKNSQNQKPIEESLSADTHSVKYQHQEILSDQDQQPAKISSFARSDSSSDSDTSSDENKSQKYNINGESLVSGNQLDYNKHEERVKSHSQLTPKSSTSSLNIHSLRQQTSGLDEAIRQQHKLLSPKASDAKEKPLDSSFSDVRSSRSSVSSVKSGKETSFNRNFFNISVSSESSDDGKTKPSEKKDTSKEKSVEAAWPSVWSSHKQTTSGFLKQTGHPEETKKKPVSQRSSLSSSHSSLSNIHNEEVFRQNPLRSSSSSSSLSSQTSVSKTGIVDKLKEGLHVTRSDGDSRKSSLSQKSPLHSRLHSNSSDKEESVKAIDENELLTKSEFQKRRENFEKLRLEREQQSNLNGGKPRADGRTPLRAFGRIEESTSFQAVKNSLVPKDFTSPVDIKKQDTGQTGGRVDLVRVEPPPTDARPSALLNVPTSHKPRADSVDEYRSDSSTSSSDDSVNSKNKNLSETKEKLSQFLRDFQKGNQKRSSGKVKDKSNPPTVTQKTSTSDSIFPSLTSFDSDSEDSRGRNESRRRFENVKTEYIRSSGRLKRSSSSSSESDSSEKMTAIVGEVSSFGIRKEMTSHDESSTVTRESRSSEGSHVSPLPQDSNGSDIYLFQRPQGDVYVLQEVLPNQRDSRVNVNPHVLNDPDHDGAHVILNHSGAVGTNHHDGFSSSGTTDLIVDSSNIEDDAARDVIAAFLDAQELSKKRQSHSSAQLNHDSVHTHSRGAGEGSYVNASTGGLLMHNGSVDHNSASSLPTPSPGVVVVHHKTEYTDSQTENSSFYSQPAPHSGIYDPYFDKQAAGNNNRVHDSSRIVVDNARAWNSQETDSVLNERRHEGAHTNTIVLNNTDAQHQNRQQINHWQDSAAPSGFVLISPTTHAQPLMVNVNDSHPMVNPYQSTPITVTTTTQAVVGEKVDMKIDFSPPIQVPVTTSSSSSSSSDDESVTKRYVVKSAPQKSSLKKSSRYDSDPHDSSSEFVYTKTDTLTANVRVGGQNRDVVLTPRDPDTSYTPRYVSRSESQSPNSADGSLYQKRSTRGLSHSPNTSYSSTYVTSPPRENQTYFTYDPHRRGSRNSDTRSSSLTSARNLSRSVPESLHVISSPRRSREPTNNEKSYRVVSGSKKHHSPERFFKNPTLSLRKDEYEGKGYSSGEESEPKQYRTVTKLYLNGEKPRSPSPTSTQYKVTTHTQETLDKHRDTKLENDTSFYEVRKVKASGRGGSSSDDSEPSSPFQKEQKRYRVFGTSDSALNKHGRSLTSPGLNSSHEKSFEEATITRTEQVLPSRLHSVPPSTKTHKTVIQLEVGKDKKFKEKYKTDEDYVDSRYMIKNTKSDDGFHSETNYKVSNAAPHSSPLWRTGRAKSMESLNRGLRDYDDDPRNNLGTSPRMVKTMKQKEGNRLYVINSTVGDSGGDRRSQNPPGWFKSTIDINENYPEARDRNVDRSREAYTSSQSLNDERTNFNSHTTEKTLYYVRQKTPAGRTRSSEFVLPDSGQGTEIASSDGENDSRHKYERVERIYEVRTEPQIPEHLASTEDLHNDLRVLRGKILIQNRLDGSEHDEDDFDENANLFDSSFHLGKDNPLYSSDPDIMASLQREEQAELSKHMHQDITYETVDRIAQRYKTDRGQELSPKPKRKQNLSALLLSKLASVDSKDIRQTIDVEHHNEEIYGDIDFIHADGQRSGSRNTSNFDSVNEKVELTLTQGKAYVIIKVIAERIVPTDYEFNVWRKSQAIVTRQIEIDLLANEQRRRLYQHVMESAGNAGYLEEDGSRRRRHPLDQADGLSQQERQLSSMETLKLFSQILDVAEGQGDKDHTDVRTKQEMGQLPGTAADLLY